MIPKIIHYCWLSNDPIPSISNIIWIHGRNICLIMSLFIGILISLINHHLVG